MANRHFAKLADVWKHLPLAEILSIERPSNYWESHAGNATYPMVADAERRYGALRFADVAAAFPAMERSNYLARLRSMNPPPGRLALYPGSPFLAMSELGATTSYLFCDTDDASASDLEAAACRLGLESTTRVLRTDGVAALHDSLHHVDGPILAHVDPYDPRAYGPSGLSALDIAGELIQAGSGVVYWYGYDRPDRRTWAFDTLRQSSSTTIWCGDVMIGSHDEQTSGGDLGVATTPGTGFGIVCANISAQAIDACRTLGEELARAYDGIPLPDGVPGKLDFITRVADAAA